MGERRGRDFNRKANVSDSFPRLGPGGDQAVAGCRSIEMHLREMSQLCGRDSERTRSHGRLSESRSGNAQVFYEHCERLMISPIRAVSSGDAQRLRCVR